MPQTKEDAIPQVRVPRNILLRPLRESPMRRIKK
jgi:hypothetical protein